DIRFAADVPRALRGAGVRGDVLVRGIVGPVSDHRSGDPAAGLGRPGRNRPRPQPARRGDGRGCGATSARFGEDRLGLSSASGRNGDGASDNGRGTGTRRGGCVRLPGALLDGLPTPRAVLLTSRVVLPGAPLWPPLELRAGHPSPAAGFPRGFGRTSSSD